MAFPVVISLIDSLPARRRRNLPYELTSFPVISQNSAGTESLSPQEYLTEVNLFIHFPPPSSPPPAPVQRSN
jgi:hypothetical protein